MSRARQRSASGRLHGRGHQHARSDRSRPSAHSRSATSRSLPSGQAGVEQQQLEGLPALLRLPDRACGLGGAGRRRRGHPQPASSLARGCAARSRCRRRPARARRRARAGRRGGPMHRAPLPAEAQRDVEGAALAELALHPEAAAHHLGEAVQMARPRPVPPNLRVVEPSACSKGAKMSFCFAGGDADARVAHGDVQDHVAGRARGLVSSVDAPRSTTSPARGELDGVAHQVHEHLLEAQRVADRARRARRGPRGRRSRAPSGARSRRPS